MVREDELLSIIRLNRRAPREKIKVIMQEYKEEELNFVVSLYRVVNKKIDGFVGLERILNAVRRSNLSEKNIYTHKVLLPYVSGMVREFGYKMTTLVYTNYIDLLSVMNGSQLSLGDGIYNVYSSALNYFDDNRKRDLINFKPFLVYAYLLLDRGLREKIKENPKSFFLAYAFTRYIKMKLLGKRCIKNCPPYLALGIRSSWEVREIVKYLKVYGRSIQNSLEKVFYIVYSSGNLDLKKILEEIKQDKRSILLSKQLKVSLYF